MTKHNNDGYLDAIQERMDGDMLKAMLEVMAQRLMEEELALHLGAERHERTRERKGHRNGYKPRSLKTRVGELGLSVPQARGTQPYSPLLFAKWERSERALLVACAEMYFMGVSTRKVKRVLEKMGGFELSASTVSCVAQELDETLTGFRQRRLDELRDSGRDLRQGAQEGPGGQPGGAGGGGDQRRGPARNPHLAPRRRRIRRQLGRGLSRTQTTRPYGCAMAHLRWARRHPGGHAHSVQRRELATLLDPFHA